MDQKRFITAGGFIDGTGSDIRKKIFLEVQGGSIASIGSVAELTENDEVIIDDFSHCLILPALFDCSVSLLRSPSVDENVRLSAKEADSAKKKVMVERHIAYCHAYGIQGMAVHDNLSELKGCLSEDAEENELIDIRTSDDSCCDRLHGIDDGREDADFLWIGYSDSIDAENSSFSRLNHDDLRRILKKKGSKKAVVVANGIKEVAEALAAGCDAVEQGYGMGEENLRKMSERNVLWIPNVVRAKNALDGSGTGGSVSCRFSQRYAAPGKQIPGIEAFWKKIVAGQIEQLRFARKLGVITAVGTGAGSIGILHGESMIEEMKLFMKAGFPLQETFKCASENGARFFGLKKMGALTVGRSATFLIARGAVQQLPRKLSFLENIYVNGAPSVNYCKNPIIKS